MTNVSHHTILLGPRYRGLLNDIFENESTIAKDMSLYLHRPTATDPTLAPAGCDGFYVLSPVPHLDGRIDWTTAGRTLPSCDRTTPVTDDTAGPGKRESPPRWS